MTPQCFTAVKFVVYVWDDFQLFPCDLCFIFLNPSSVAKFIGEIPLKSRMH